VNKFDIEPFIETYNGRRFWPLDPRVEDVSIIDIAHALSHQCRFTGHSKVYYSVAEHCVRVSYACDPEDALWGLLHDASEAYMHDIATPIKYQPEFAAYRKAEAKLQTVIFEAFGLHGPCPASVKQADIDLLLTEKRDLMLPSERWPFEGKPQVELIVPYSHKDAKSKFLARYMQLSGMEYR